MTPPSKIALEGLEWGLSSYECALFLHMTQGQLSVPTWQHTAVIPAPGDLVSPFGLHIHLHTYSTHIHRHTHTGTHWCSLSLSVCLSPHASYHIENISEMDLATIVKPKSAKHLKETEEIHGEHGLTKKHFTVILKIPPIKIPES